MRRTDGPDDEAADRARILRNIIWRMAMKNRRDAYEGEVDTPIGRRTVWVELGEDGRTREIVPQWMPLEGTHRRMRKHRRASEDSWEHVPYDPPPVGSIVMCRTNPWHRFGISRYMGGRGTADSPFLVREIGGAGLCVLEDESLYLLIGVGEEYLSEGAEYRMYEIARMALDSDHNESDFWLRVRFGGAEFPSEGVIRIHVEAVKAKFVGDGWRSYRPRTFDVPYGDSTQVKDIIEELAAGGYDRPWTDAELAETDDETT